MNYIGVDVHDLYQGICPWIILGQMSVHDLHRGRYPWLISGQMSMTYIRVDVHDLHRGRYPWLISGQISMTYIREDVHDLNQGRYPLDYCMNITYHLRLTLQTLTYIRSREHALLQRQLKPKINIWMIKKLDMISKQTNISECFLNLFNHMLVRNMTYTTKLYQNKQLYLNVCQKSVP